MINDRELPPKISELEVTLIGPGYGESILVHIGNNNWIIIDSCIDTEKESCAPLDYLKSIGVAPSNVCLIVASHWHDDHVRGISTLVQACTNAKFSCSIALNRDEFLAYVTKFETDCSIKWGSGVSEFYKTLEIIRQRRSQPPPIHATCNKRILYKSSNELLHQYNCEVWSLSPSDGEIESFINEIRNIIPISQESQCRSHQTRNNISVVIQVIVGNEIFLLGSDLEETKDPHTGWSVIVDSKEKPNGKAKIFKIPHHGSHTGHSDDVWNQMIENESFALLTPFNRGNKLPSNSDIKRIQQLTKTAFTTTPQKSNKTIKRSSLVEKTISETVGKIRSITNKSGIIRMRKTLDLPSSDWEIELFNGACHLSDLPS